MLGLMLANGLVALAGSIYCQYGSVYNSDMGTGTVVIALACVIIGCVVAKHIRTLKKIFRKRRKGDAGTAIDP